MTKDEFNGILGKFIIQEGGVKKYLSANVDVLKPIESNVAKVSDSEMLGQKKTIEVESLITKIIKLVYVEKFVKEKSEEVAKMAKLWGEIKAVVSECGVNVLFVRQEGADPWLAGYSTPISYLLSGVYHEKKLESMFSDGLEEFLLEILRNRDTSKELFEYVIKNTLLKNELIDWQHVFLGNRLEYEMLTDGFAQKVFDLPRFCDLFDNELEQSIKYFCNPKGVIGDVSKNHGLRTRLAMAFLGHSGLSWQSKETLVKLGFLKKMLELFCNEPLSEKSTEVNGLVVGSSLSVAVAITKLFQDYLNIPDIKGEYPLDYARKSKGLVNILMEHGAEKRKHWGTCSKLKLALLGLCVSKKAKVETRPVNGLDLREVRNLLTKTALESKVSHELAEVVNMGLALAETRSGSVSMLNEDEIKLKIFLGNDFAKKLPRLVLNYIEVTSKLKKHGASNMELKEVQELLLTNIGLYKKTLEEFNGLCSSNLLDGIKAEMRVANRVLSTKMNS